MTDPIVSASSSTSEKSSLWIGGNIAAVIILTSFILGFVVSALFGSTIQQSAAASFVLALVLTVLGGWLGVKYVQGKTRINSVNIPSISLVAAGIPFLIFALFLVLGSSQPGSMSFNWAELVARLGATVLVFLVVQYSLRSKAV